MNILTMKNIRIVIFLIVQFLLIWASYSYGYFSGATYEQSKWSHQIYLLNEVIERQSQNEVGP